MGKISDSVMQLVSPIAESFGLEVVEVVYDKKFNGMNLTIFIDKDGTIDILDCERLHRAIDEPLDGLECLSEAYILNVSSLGIDRPLKTDRDFNRNMGGKITVKLYKTDEAGNKQYDGVLAGFDSENFTVTTADGSTVTLVRGQVAHVEPIIEF